MHDTHGTVHQMQLHAALQHYVAQYGSKLCRGHAGSFWCWWLLEMELEVGQGVSSGCYGAHTQVPAGMQLCSTGACLQLLQQAGLHLQQLLKAFREALITDRSLIFWAICPQTKRVAQRVQKSVLVHQGAVRSVQRFSLVPELTVQLQHWRYM